MNARGAWRWFRGRSRRFQVVSWVGVVVVILIIIGAADGGGGNSEKKTAGGTTSSSTAATTSTATTKTNSAAAQNAGKEKSKTGDSARAAEIKRRFEINRKALAEEGVTAPEIVNVKVNSGAVEVETKLYWKHDNEPEFIGICTNVDKEPWVREVVVLAASGHEGADWVPSYGHCKSRVPK
jgi:hypothetical protein